MSSSSESFPACLRRVRRASPSRTRRSKEVHGICVTNLTSMRRKYQWTSGDPDRSLPRRGGALDVRGLSARKLLDAERPRFSDDEVSLPPAAAAPANEPVTMWGMPARFSAPTIRENTSLVVTRRRAAGHRARTRSAAVRGRAPRRSTWGVPRRAPSAAPPSSDR